MIQLIYAPSLLCTRMAYGTTAPVTYLVVDSIMDFIFMTDVGLNFLTGEVQYLSICCRCVGVCVCY